MTTLTYSLQDGVLQQTGSVVHTVADHSANLVPTAYSLSSTLNPLDGLGHQLISTGQHFLIIAGGVVAVASGILIVLGMKSDGFRRFWNVFQGLGVGIFGPVAVSICAVVFLGIAGQFHV